jgi:hypothetical protein
MKAILFISILGFISSVPVYAAAGSAGAGHAGGNGSAAGHAANHAAGHSGGGWQMSAIHSSTIANKDVTPPHSKKKAQSGGYVEDPKVTQSRINWQRQQQAAQLRAHF